MIPHPSTHTYDKRKRHKNRNALNLDILFDHQFGFAIILHFVLHNIQTGIHRWNSDQIQNQL